jgi:hypothetical protein
VFGGFAPPALLGEREPQVVVGLGVAGLDPQGLLVVPDRLVAPPLLENGVPQIIVRVGMAGIDLHGLLAAEKL